MALEDHDRDPEKTLDQYIHDYLMKKNLHHSAEVFKRESNVTSDHVAVDVPDGFLKEWWSMFYDVYRDRQSKFQNAKAEQMRNEFRPTLSPPALDQQSQEQFCPSSSVVVGQPAASAPPANKYDEEPSNNQSSSSSFQPIDYGINLPMLASVSSTHMQQEMYKQDERTLTEGNIHGISLRNCIDTNSATFREQDAVLPISGPWEAARSAGAPVLLKGRPLNASDRPQFELPIRQLEHLPQMISQAPGKQSTDFLGSSRSSSNHNSIPFSHITRDMDREMMSSIRQMEESHHYVNQVQEQQLRNDGKRKRFPYPGIGSSNLEDKPLNVESDFSQDDDIADDTGAPFSTLKRRSTACQVDHKGFSFKEFAHLHTSKSEVLCCHFSSDGKLLANAGHDKKVFLWDVQRFELLGRLEGHSLPITDVHFRPNSSVFATSSFDKTVQIWNATQPSKSPFKLLGHGEQVMSLDFHPGESEVLCSCDSNSEIRFWNIKKKDCIRISKQRGNQQVRFQPQTANLLAAAAGNVINVIDIEKDSLLFSLKGHINDVRAICWEPSGRYIASVSEDSARVWSSVSGGKCIHALHSSGSNFQSCTFHPGYLQLLVIGGYQTLELWNPGGSSKTMTVPAHKGLISALADSVEREMIATASHDKSVKLWR